MESRENGQHEVSQIDEETPPPPPPLPTDPSAATSSDTEAPKQKSSKTRNKEIVADLEPVPQLHFRRKQEASTQERPLSDIINSSTGSGQSNISITGNAIKPPVKVIESDEPTQADPDNEPSNSATSAAPLAAQPEPEEEIVTVPGEGETHVDVKLTDDDDDTLNISMVNPPPGQKSLMPKSPNNTNQNNKRCVIS